MLRRRPDSTWEFRLVEEALALSLPQPLRLERREALRLRIMASLGEQESPRRLLSPAVRERWVLVPAGIGLAAAIIAANQVLDRQPDKRDNGPTYAAASSRGDVLVNGVAGAKFGPGDRVEARTQAWLTVGDGAGVGLEAGAVVRFLPGAQVSTFALERGSATFASGTLAVNVGGDTWSASLRQGSVASFALLAMGVNVTVQEGEVAFQGLGRVQRLTPGAPYVFAGEPPASATEEPAGASAPPAAVAVAAAPGAAGETQASPPQQVGDPNPPGNNAGGQEPDPPANNAGGNGDGQGNPNPPGNNAGGASGQEPNPPANNAGGNGNGQGNPTPPGNNAGGASGSEPNPPANNAGGNGNGQGNPNPPGNNAGGNGGGSASPPGNNAGGGGGPKKAP